MGTWAPVGVAIRTRLRLSGFCRRSRSVAHVDRIALQTLDGGRDVPAADGRHDDVVDVVHGQPVSGRFLPLDDEIHVVPAGHPLGIDASGTGKAADDRFDLFSEPLQDLKVRPRDLDAHRRLDAGRQHVDARLDRKGPGVGHAREVDQVIQLRGQFLDGHSGPPLLLRLQDDRRFHHLQRRRIERGVGPSHLGKGVLDLRDGHDQLVRLLGHGLGLGDRDAGLKGRHVEQVPFVERGNELRAEAFIRHDGEDQDDYGGCQHDPAELQAPAQDGTVDPDEKPVDGVLRLGENPPPDQVSHEHRDDGDRQDRGGGHGVGLRERQGPEHPARLTGEGEHRKERNGDDHEGVKERRSHLFGGIDDDIPVRLFPPVPLQVLMGVLDHDDGPVDHGADGDGDAAQGHDVGDQPLPVHDRHGHQDADGQGEDGHEGRAEVEKEDDADDGDDDALFDQLAAKRVLGAVDQGGPVVDGDDLAPLRADRASAPRSSALRR